MMAETDLISRQAAIDAIENTEWYHQNASKEMAIGASDEHQAWYKAEDVYKALESVPSAQPERKNGRWEMKPDPFGFFEEIPVCSECGCTTKMRDKTKFCPHCGAQMEGQ